MQGWFKFDFPGVSLGRPESAKEAEALKVLYLWPHFSNYFDTTSISYNTLVCSILFRCLLLQSAKVSSLRPFALQNTDILSYLEYVSTGCCTSEDYSVFIRQSNSSDLQEVLHKFREQSLVTFLGDLSLVMNQLTAQS